MEISFVNEIFNTGAQKKNLGRIIIDGIKDNDSRLIYNEFFIETLETFTKLNQASLEELYSHFSYIFYSFNVEWSEYLIHLMVSFPNNEGNDRSISVHFEISYIKWNKPYSLYEFIEKHKEIITSIEGVEYHEIEDGRDEMIGTFFTLDATIENTAKPLGEYIDFALEKFKEAHLLSLEFLNNKYPADGISIFYEFPHEIRAACNQYLMYFAQFLEDLGISAETSLKEQANQVLFTITPKDKNQALDVIYKALVIYMEASNEEVNKNITESDLAVIQWKANIFHLRSQLELSRAILQAKDETIEALKIANYQLQSFISNSQANEELENKDEKVLGGLATVNNLKLKGITINLPEILRRLKRRFH